MIRIEKTSRRLLLRSRCLLRRAASDIGGLAAIEFALIAGFLAVSALNVSDVAVYLFDEIQVNNATEMGAQAAWNTCDLNHLPATTKCTTMTSAITTAIQSTPLGSGVALQSGSPSEAFYCANSSGTLQYMADITSPPADCTAAGVSTELPGDYVEVQASYSYRPMFPGLSVASLFPAKIGSTAWTRLGS